MPGKRAAGHALAERVADAIQAECEKYDQRTYIHPCGTPACIAGWTAFVMDELFLEPGPGTGEAWVAKEEHDPWETATRGLELDRDEAVMMFGVDPFRGTPPTADEAAQTLRRYATTDRVKWISTKELTR